jgi:acyl dehydratase
MATVTVMGPAELADRRFGPHPLVLTSDRVSRFVHVTGDDHTRWVSSAPPGFAAAALFVVAPELLAEVGDRSVIHGEQTFEWSAPLVIGSTLDVSGVVTRVRERSGVDYVGFAMSADESGRRVLSGSSLFLVTGPSPASGTERPEPGVTDRGAPRAGQRSASRADLVEYAAASGDWNPIHWDHDSAVAAGLPGVVAHGLLQTAWALAEASRLVDAEAPLASARVRYRTPLEPAHPVDVILDRQGPGVTVSLADAAEEYLSARIELSHG